MRTILNAIMAAALVALLPAALTFAAQLTDGYSNPKIVLLERTGDDGKRDGSGPYWTWSTGDPAQSDPDKRKPKPMDPSRAKVRDDMIKRRVLEEYTEFLSPLRLPRTLRVIASDCTGSEWDSPYYDSDNRWMNMCYSFVGAAAQRAHVLAQNQAKMNLPIPVNEDQLMAGLFAATVLHETGHAVFDILNAPVFGREEDGADQMAIFLAVQFNDETARTIVKGFAYYWYVDAILKNDPGALDPSAPDYPKSVIGQCQVDRFCGYYDEHGTASQRMYNVLCLAYGGNKKAFQDLVDNKWLTDDRARHCGDEYAQAYKAFGKTVYPFIDRAQMEKMKARQGWFLPAEVKEK